MGVIANLRATATILALYLLASMGAATVRDSTSGFTLSAAFVRLPIYPNV